MSIPYTSYSQLPLFTATTVHSHTEHNTPHQRLIDNDNNLQSQVSALSSSVSAQLSALGRTVRNISWIVATGTPLNADGTIVNPANNTTINTAASYTKLDSTTGLLVCWMANLNVFEDNREAGVGFTPLINGVQMEPRVWTYQGGEHSNLSYTPVAPWRYKTPGSLAAGTINLGILIFSATSDQPRTSQTIEKLRLLVIEL